MTDHVNLPSNPNDRQKVKQMLAEMTHCLQRADDEKESMKEIAEEVYNQFAIPKKIKFVKSENGTHLFHLEGGIIGGDTKTCYYAMYLNVTITAYSMLWGLLYTFISAPNRSKKG